MIIVDQAALQNFAPNAHHIRIANSYILNLNSRDLPDAGTDLPNTGTGLSLYQSSDQSSPTNVQQCKESED